MAEVDNPFEAFEGADNPKTADHRMLLAQTQPWLIVFGCFMALGAVGGLFGAGIMGVMGAAGVLGASGNDEFAAAGVAGGFTAFLVILYGLMALLYGALAYFLIRQATAISTFRRVGGLEPLADVLRAHRDFWRVSGMSMVALMVLYCGGIGLMVSLGMAGAAFGG